MTVIGHDRMGPTVFKALRRGEMLAMLVDVATRKRRASASTSSARPRSSRLPPRASRCARTPGWCRPSSLRGPKDDVEIRPIIDTSLRDFAPTGDEARDVRELTRLIMASLEQTIRRYPDQWFIFRRLWTDTATARASARALAEEV